MPSTYAHYVFGSEVYQRYPNVLKEKLAPCLPLYHIGLQEEAGEGELRDQRLAYLCGFLCHFALDSSCHGYVEKKIQVSGLTHTEIEVEFDRFLLVRDGKDPLRQCLTEHIIPTPENARVIAPFFPTVPAKDVERSLRSMILYNRLLIAPRPAKRHLICTLLRLTGNYREMHGLLVNPEPNPACRDSNAGLMKRLEEAVPLCLRLTDNFKRSCGTGRSRTHGFSGRSPSRMAGRILSYRRKLR